MPLEITEDRVRAAAAELHDGGWSFSGRQLYYAVCAAVEAPPPRTASAELGLGVLLILVGAVTGQRILLEVLGALGLVLLIAGAVTRVQERRPLPSVRPLAISRTEFERRFLDAGHEYEGLVDPSVMAAMPAGRRLVVCDRADSAAVLAANASRLEDVAVAVRGDEPPDVHGRRVVVLHDCDPAGCGLVAELGDRGAEVVDAGIRPRELAGRRLQVVEGAPARLPRDLSAHFDAAEMDWLRSGRRVECATETPARLVERVRGMLA